jgi:hypothetical protein
MAATLVFRLTGGASNSTPGSSLGGIMSDNAVSGTALNNLFDDVTPAERVAGIAKEYRAIDVYNSGDATAESVALYMSTPTSSTGTVLHLGYDVTNNDHIAGWDGETIGSDTTDPASPVISFDERTSSEKLTLPDIPASKAVRVWVKRIVTAGVTNTANDTGTLAVDYA